MRISSAWAISPTQTTTTEKTENKTEKTTDLKELKKQLDNKFKDKIKSEILKSWLWIKTTDKQASDYLIKNGFKFSNNYLRFYYSNDLKVKRFYKNDEKRPTFRQLKNKYKTDETEA